MIRYSVRSRYLVDLVNEVRSEKLVLAPYFQRKLVWRLAHKVDFIKTIKLGFPFPEIFVARGDIDVQSMQSTSALVDGQQRMSAITEFLKDGFPVDGQKYSEMESTEKETFLKYEIAIIDLDMHQDDKRIIELFKRLNRTFYALSTIEKLSTEFGSSEFMLTAKLLSGELKEKPTSEHLIAEDRHESDPNITVEFTKWARKQKLRAYSRLVAESSIFSKFEIARQVHLMFTLNTMATLVDGYFARNELATTFLETKAENFPERQQIMARIERGALRFNRLQLSEHSFWLTKSNAFTLLVALALKKESISNAALSSYRSALVAFSHNPPEDYALAAKEGVNNRKERLLRARYIEEILS